MKGYAVQMLTYLAGGSIVKCPCIVGSSVPLLLSCGHMPCVVCKKALPPLQHGQHLLVAQAGYGLGLIVVVTAIFPQVDIKIDVGRG